MGELLEEEWLTVKQVARMLNLPRSTVYMLIRTRQLRAVYIGRTIRVPKRFLEAFVQERALPIG